MLKKDAIDKFYDSFDFTGYLGCIWLYSLEKQTFRAITLKEKDCETLHKDIPLTSLNQWFKKLKVPRGERTRRALFKTFPVTYEDAVKKQKEALSRKIVLFRASDIVYCTLPPREELERDFNLTTVQQLDRFLEVLSSV